MILIVGLGNPGKTYASTRHNIGYMVVEKLAQELTRGQVKWHQNNTTKSELYKIENLILIKPTTYMNLSGISVKETMDFYKIQLDNVWIIHDDIDLPLGKIRVKIGGGSGGHNGIESIMKILKSEKLTRFRIGVGRDAISSIDNKEKHTRHQAVINFVLSKFTENEAGDVRKLITSAVKIVQIALNDGIVAAMNKNK